jgi:hypothetical protein
MGFEPSTSISMLVCFFNELIVMRFEAQLNDENIRGMRGRDKKDKHQ